MWFVVGVGLLITPGIIAVLNGARDDGDFVSWLANQPLQTIIMLQTITRLGYAVMTMAVIDLIWRL